VTCLEEGINLHSCLCNTRQRPLRALASAPQPTESARVVRYVVFGFPLELIFEMLQQSVVEILSAQVGVARGSLDGEDATTDVEEGDIKGSSSKIENENILLAFSLTIKAVSNSSGSRLIDNTEDV
jgi:hypothetical protein